MNRQEIIAELRAFPYDRADYWVLTGGAMVLYGIRSETSDIDLGCSKALADRLEADGYLCGTRQNGKRRFRYGACIEIFEGWLNDRIGTVDGVPVISIEGLIEMKRALGREKDRRDLALIEAFQQKQTGDRSNQPSLTQGKGVNMEEQKITITVKTKGGSCELSDAEIVKWYTDKLSALFDPKWGTPEITVKLERNTL